MNNNLQKISPIIGVSANIAKTKELINHVADTDLNIIICGESGVGKEVVAQNLYQKSPRNGKPFIKINCAALPEGLLESELFGYERGAFTGAHAARKGVFEEAHGGTLFLDEISSTVLQFQAKLLRALETQEIRRVGENRIRKVNVRIIAASNTPLDNLVTLGRFR